MTDTEGDGICCEFGIGEFKITVNGEPVAVGNNGKFGDFIQETFGVVDVVEAPTRAPTSAPCSAPTSIQSNTNEVSAGTFAILSGSCCLVLLLQLVWS
jgi:hypothetical protein